MSETKTVSTGKHCNGDSENSPKLAKLTDVSELLFFTLTVDYLELIDGELTVKAERSAIKRLNHELFINAFLCRGEDVQILTFLSETEKVVAKYRVKQNDE